MSEGSAFIGQCKTLIGEIFREPDWMLTQCGWNMVVSLLPVHQLHLKGIYLFVVIMQAPLHRFGKART